MGEGEEKRSERDWRGRDRRRERGARWMKGGKGWVLWKRRGRDGRTNSDPNFIIFIRLINCHSNCLFYIEWSTITVHVHQ